MKKEWKGIAPGFKGKVCEITSPTLRFSRKFGRHNRNRPELRRDCDSNASFVVMYFVFS